MLRSVRVCFTKSGRQWKKECWGIVFVVVGVVVHVLTAVVAASLYFVVGHAVA